jgi:UPF0716 protein FxsA
MRGLFFLFVVLPILELWLLIQVGSKIGALSTIILVFLTAIVGSWLLRQQGLKTLMSARSKMEAGQLPAKEMAEGICLAVGGALLLTPGFITDAIGLACLIPGIRGWVATFFMARTVVRAGQGRAFEGNQPGSRYSATDARQGDVIEGEFQSDQTEPADKVSRD